MTRKSRTSRSKWMAVFLLYMVLGTWKGYLALFEGNAKEPRQIFPIEVASLPETDQTSLGFGIVIRNEKRLQELLEFYLS